MDGLVKENTSLGHLQLHSLRAGAALEGDSQISGVSESEEESDGLASLTTTAPGSAEEWEESEPDLDFDNDEYRNPERFRELMHF